MAHIGYGPHWINLTIFTFINENNRNFRSLYKFWNKIISFNMRKKTSHGKSEEKNEFGNL